MKTLIKFIPNYKIFLTSLLIVSITGCGSDNNEISVRGNLISTPLSVTKQTTTQTDAIVTMSPALASLNGSAKCDVTVMQLNYKTPGVQEGEMSNASAALFIPSGANCPSGPYPLIAFARGTDFEKAYSNADTTNPATQVLMAVYAAQGYVVVATDYLGYSLSEYPYHPFLHADTEASAVIDSIRAARNAASELDLELNGKVMLNGFSQGGHAAMSTQRVMEQENAGEFNLVASAHMAGPYEVSKALIEGASNPIGGAQAIVPFQITAWQKVYGDVYTNISDVFKSPYDSFIESLFPVVDLNDLAKIPQGTAAEAISEMFQDNYILDLANNPDNATIVAAKKQNLLGWNPNAPTKLCAGFNDPVVRFFNTQDVLDDFSNRGLTNVSLEDVDDTIAVTFASVKDTNMTKYKNNYHASYVLPTCSIVAKNHFDLYK